MWVVYMLPGSNYIYMWQPRHTVDQAPWSWHEILVFLSHFSSGPTVQRLNARDTTQFKYRILRGADPILKLGISRDLTRGWVQLTTDPATVFTHRVVVNGPPTYFLFGFPFFFSSFVAPVKGHSILHGLFNSVRQIILQSGQMECAAMCLPHLFCQGVKTTRGRGHQAESFEKFLNDFDGLVLLKVDRGEADLPLPAWRQPFFVQHGGANYRVVALAAICPQVFSAMSYASYCELDATFYCMKPYVACIPQFVHMNCAYPVGLILGPSESSDLYELFHEGLYRFHQLVYGERRPFTFTLDVLSDAHSGLRRFCQDHQLRRFQCHRHLIEWFGTKALLKAMVLKVLRSPSYNKMIENVGIANSVVAALKSRNELAEKQLNKYLAFTGQTLSDEDGRFYPLPDRDKVVSEWALWARGCVTSCSNHAESFHRVLRAVVKPNGKHVGIGKCLTEVIKAIQRKQASWKDGFMRNLQYYRRSSDLPISWARLKEVARRFEVDIPNELLDRKDVTEEEVFDEITKVGLDRLQRINIAKVTGAKSRSIDPWKGEPFGARRKKQPSEQVEEIVPDDTGVVALARDIFQGLSFETRENLDFHWVFHWVASALEESGLDSNKDVGEAYILAWNYVHEKLKRLQ